MRFIVFKGWPFRMKKTTERKLNYGLKQQLLCKPVINLNLDCIIIFYMK